MKEESTMHKPSILVVEDENIVAKDIQARLTRLGYDVPVVVSTGAEAIERAGSHTPDLVLMDIMLGGEMDGIQAAEEIRTRFSLAVVYLTAYADEHTLQRAKVTEAFGYLLKPFEERELHITIEMALYKHRIERQLKESQRWLETILKSIGDGVVAANTEGLVTFMNPLAESLTGWKQEDASGKHLSEVFRDGSEMQPSTQGAASDPGSEATAETVLISRGGKPVPIEKRTTPIRDDAGRTNGTVMVFRDITERKQAEDVVRESRARLAGIVQSAMDPIISIDDDYRIVVFNGAAELVFRCASAEAIGTMLDRFIPMPQREVHRQHVALFGRNGLTKRMATERGVLSGIRADGEEFPLEASISQIEADGKKYYTVVIRDITERKKAEEALKQSEERYRRFFEEDLTGDYIATPDGVIRECNPAFARIFGFESVSDAKSANVNEFYRTTESRDSFFGSLSRERKLEYYEKELVRTDGAEVYVIENIIGTFDEDGALIEYKGYMFDNTERKLLEEQLRQSQKMESIGTLASGIAHDFNNILNNVMGFALQIKKHANDQAKILRYGETIERSAARGAELSSQLLSFARKSKRESIPTDIRPVLDEVVSLCRETFPKTIEVQKQVGESLLLVSGDHGELYQVLLNLCVNARDAVTAREEISGGKIVVGARNVHTDEAHIAHSAMKGVPMCVELSVSDNGIGIPKSIKDKVFDPFFTTKERGRGTGLGLSVVYSSVRNHQGVLQVESEEGTGTIFRVFLPALVGGRDAMGGTEDQESRQGGDELVMIVDDEESMQELGRELLEEQGYKVVIASGGADAVALYSARAKEIAIVVLDLVMPGMDGGQTYLQLKKINPGIRAFFCTGYMPDEVITALLEEENLRAIQKPFDPQTFVRVVREVLDEKR